MWENGARQTSMSCADMNVLCRSRHVYGKTKGLERMGLQDWDAVFQFSGRWQNPISRASHQSADVAILITSQVSTFWADQHLLEVRHGETRAFESDVDG
jgi:hypothetical protein